MEFEELRLLATGFQPAKLLLVALDLGLFDCLAESARDASEIGAQLGVDARATEIACNALVALGVLEKDADRYRNAPVAREHLVTAAGSYRGAILRHIHNTWEDWDGLAETWRSGRPALRRKRQQLPSSPEGVRNFILGMENITRELAPRLAALLPLAGCRSALDVGGGPGNYALAFARAAPELRVVHFDLPETSAIARAFVAGKVGAERVRFLEGDFLCDPLGGGYDFVWVSQIIHMLSEEELRTLMGRVADALAPGGWLAVHDHFLDAARTAPRAAALFGVHMLVATSGGRTYALDELRAWVAPFGLRPEGVLETGGVSRVLLVRKAGVP